MNETATPTRVLYPEEEVRPTFRSSGSNPPEADGNSVQHIDMARSVFSRAIQQLWPAAAPTKPAPTPPRVPPEQELAQQEKHLTFLRAQHATATALLTSDPRDPTTAITSVASVSARYRSLLSAGVDVAAMPLADIRLLADVLSTPQGQGLLDITTERVRQLREQLRPAEVPSAEHRRLIQAEEKAFRSWAKARRARQEHEASTAGCQRHQLRAPRPKFGMNFGHVSGNELDRTAAFALSLPESAK